MEEYRSLDEDAQADAKAALDGYMRLYAFMGQVMPDPEARPRGI